MYSIISIELYNVCPLAALFSFATIAFISN